MPDLHRPGYEYPPYREAVDFKYDVHNGFFQTRIGNDSDLIHFFKSSGPELEDALLACLKGADDTMKIEVLKAGSTLSEAGDARFTLAALNLSEDSNAEVRQTVRYVYEDGQRGILNLDTPCAPDPHLVAKVVEILKHGNPDSQAVVLPLLAALPSDSRLGTADGGPGRASRSMLEATAAAGELRPGAECRFVVQRPDARAGAAGSGVGWTERSLTRTCSAPPCGFPWSTSWTIRRPAPLVKTAFANLNPSRAGHPDRRSGQSAISEEAPRSCGRRGVAGSGLLLNKNLAAVKKPKEPLEYPIVVDTVLASLLNADANVSAAALDTLRKVKGVEKRPDFRAAMEQLQNSTQSAPEAHRGPACWKERS